MRRVSVVVSCFNSARYLSECVGAIRDLEHQADQVIVVDDHSSDSTSALAAELGCQLVRHERTMGLSATRNSGLRAAEGELIAFVDADVRLARDWLTVLLPAFDRPRVAMVGGRLVERHRHTPADQWRAQEMAQDHGSSASFFDQRHPGRLSGFATLSDRAIMVAAGGYDPRFGRSYEDIDLSHRLISRGHVLMYEPDAIAYHERTDGIRSLMSSCWSWNHWPEYLAGTYHFAWRLAAKLLRNLWQGGRLASRHLTAGSYRLIPVDLSFVTLHSWWDIRYYVANCQWMPARFRPTGADLGNLGG